ncbi:uncharacterized protein MELLADRAFT_107438 [Melampsora larici-populina 98AG31]|uniref:Uncharacterized protein n=1 Tax=Melampsora larici-populina (strain 98AG31 / pathotype 3-4-7) TaxID=747676 RepID=F4RPT2_MELLP|nr:uncharacterized protein MELLADRAFT_107438 [Melampsora larici-populina 98AG31]EGG05602.1 hypothetical protein MELLADRAFT_107438 [Melampsora larici-populina 98AG31]
MRMPTLIPCHCTDCQKNAYQHPQTNDQVYGTLWRPANHKKHVKGFATRITHTTQKASLSFDISESESTDLTDTQSPSQDPQKSSTESIYSPTYYDTFRRWKPSDLAYFLMITCLHIIKNISVKAATICLHVIGVVSSFNTDRTSSHINLPKTMSTCLDGLRIEPKIRRTVCCPKCFKLYYEDNIPKFCTYQATPRSRKNADASEVVELDTESVASDIYMEEGFDNAASATPGPEMGSSSPPPTPRHLSAESNDKLLSAFEDMNLGNQSCPATSPTDDQATQEQTAISSEDEELDEDFSDCEDACDDELGWKLFDDAQNLATLQDITKNIRLPSWVGRVPSTVGTRKGGKLKADEWVILYQVMMIPAIISVLHKDGNATKFTDHNFSNLQNTTASITSDIARTYGEPKKNGQTWRHILLNLGSSPGK